MDKDESDVSAVFAAVVNILTNTLCSFPIKKSFFIRMFAFFQY